MFSQSLEDLQIQVEREVMARGGIKKGLEYLFPCPMPDHPDENPSANYNSEKGVWLCRSCSSSGGLLRGKNPLCELLGVETRSQTSPQKINITPTAPKPAPKPTVLQAAAPNPAPPKVVKKWHWDIKDVEGRYIATHHRIDYDDDSKKSPWSISGKPGLNGSKTAGMLYGCHRLGERLPGDDVPVYVVEGEKCVDALRGLGLLAVGTVCGASSTPTLEVLRCLEGRHVVCWPDNDEVGFAHMERIAALLDGVAASVKIWKPGTLTEPGHDAVDWIAARM
jgi:hypothetical protein